MDERSGPPKIFMAQRFLNLGQPEKALDLLNAVDSETIDTPFFWLLRGRAYYDLKKHHDAYQAVQKGLLVDPEDIPLLCLLCDCHAKFNNLDKAETAILSALKQVPEDPFLICRYAMLVAQAGQLDKAERLVDEAGRLAPEHPSVDRSRIVLAFLRGDDRQSARLSQDYLQKQPEDILGHYMLGSATAEQGKIGAASASFNRAVRLDPTEPSLVDSARHGRTYAHWLLLPLRPIYRFGSVPVWLFAVGTIFVLRAIGLVQLSVIFAIVYIIFVVYSWVVPPLLKRWLQRNYRSFK